MNFEQVLRRPIETAALTGKVASSTKMSGYPTYREFYPHGPREDRIRAIELQRRSSLDVRVT